MRYEHTLRMRGSYKNAIRNHHFLSYISTWCSKYFRHGKFIIGTKIGATLIYQQYGKLTFSKRRLMYPTTDHHILCHRISLRTPLQKNSKIDGISPRERIVIDEWQYFVIISVEAIDAFDIELRLLKMIFSTSMQQMRRCKIFLEPLNLSSLKFLCFSAILTVSNTYKAAKKTQLHLGRC